MIGRGVVVKKGLTWGDVISEQPHSATINGTIFGTQFPFKLGHLLKNYKQVKRDQSFKPKKCVRNLRKANLKC